jgi:light-regulated signal transduction histidine kinase (bacteriophytochrome)
MEKRVEIQVEELPEVKAPISKIRQLFKELIGNGLKFNDSTTPKVEVGYEERRSHYVFRVRDNGIGIREEDQKRIFNLFHKLHTQKEYSGIGVGLAKCRRIVESMEGRIWVDSHPDAGSTFYFTYPKEETEET